MKFQSTLPRGERPACTDLHSQSIQFQSTLPRGERPLQTSFIRSSTKISIHAPTRGATSFRSLSAGVCRIFQSTLPRGERRLPGQRPDESNVISIHAPTRGATRTPGKRPCLISYFNPRSHEGSDLSVESGQVSISDFNPRSHEGSDEAIEFLYQIEEISIHAPTRGATCSGSILFGDMSISIHAPTRGATL